MPPNTENQQFLDQENMDPSAPPAPVHHHRSRRSSGGARQVLLNPRSQNSRATSASGGGARQHKLKQRFTVIRKLGKGTYGKVQLAINKETGQEVAIKTIKKTKIENDQDLQRVRREIQIMSSIEHPHIIHIYEVFENKDKIVLVMQYAPGGELYEYVSKAKCLDDQEARRLFRQIATAIFYCHQNKICHRDLKLENILLDEKNNAKIADFGLSNVFDKSRQLKTFCGSPLYASPEIVQGSPYEGPEVDCWSLGVLLYTLVYGAMPFDGSNFKRLVRQISESTYFEPETRSNASPLIRRLLCADPLKRATILDICSDPWVNGQLVIPHSPSSRLSPSNHEESPQAAASSSPIARHSLLKVAQDMAKLTPVRLDILMALAPQSDQEIAAQAVDQPRKAEPSCDHLASAHQMEVDEARACSPVASYIVRDLDEVKGTKQEDAAATCAMIETAQPTLEAKKVDPEPEPEPVVAEDAIKVGVEAAEADGPVETAAAVFEEPGEKKSGEQTEKEITVDAETYREEKISEAVEQPVSEEPQKMQVSDPDKGLENSQEVKMDVEPAAGAEETTPTAEIKVADSAPELKAEEPVAEEQPVQEAMAVDENKSPAASGDPQEKQKKVKKKIVVVKKKKKVVKKADVAESTEFDKKKDEDSGTKPESAATKGPGKVKIPDTFQPQKAATYSEPEPPPISESRRPSALIVDVSQKLLEQSAQHSPGATSIIESDQPQLAGVRVSDKKEDFERRSSLAQINGGPPSPKLQLQQEPETAEPQPDDDTQQFKPEVRSPEPNNVEPEVQRLDDSPSVRRETEKIDIPAVLDKSASLQEPDTPSSFKSTLVEPPSPASQATSPLPEQEPTVRSSFSISLGSAQTETSGPKQPRQQLAPLKLPLANDQSEVSRPTPSTGQFSIAGPAPITRSYKKVTFTKDGARITETGRIYATQGDDGTVRRVERKSKVTHYPSPSGGAAKHQQTTVSSQETMKATAEADWSPFERLILPSAHENDLFGEQTRGHDPFGSSDIFGRNKSPLSQKDLRVAASPHSPSCSSCSSGSTDALDDIFDHWTGAMGMFQPIGLGRKRHLRHQQGGSLAGTPRCGSASGAREQIADSFWQQRPGTASGHTHHHRRHRRSSRGTCRDSSETPSGYESDVPTERPTSALNSARGRTFGSQNLFQPFDSISPLRANDRFFKNEGDSIEQSIERQHEALKRRLAQQHEQLWKGSTPSLFAQAESPVADWRLPMPSLSSRRKQPASGPLGQLLLTKQSLFDGDEFNRMDPPERQQAAFSARPPRAHRSNSSLHQQHVSQTIQTHAPQPWPRESESNLACRRASQQNLESSQSSSSFLRRSIPLDAAPIRQRPPNLPPASSGSVHRSTSRQTFTTSTCLTDANLQQATEKQVTSSASFLELKRTPSSSRAMSSVQHHEQQHQQQHQVKTETSKFISMASKPPGSASDNVDSRVQNWLQESSAANQHLANSLSTSSGSKSSVSDLSRATTTTTAGSAFGQLALDRAIPTSFHHSASQHKESTVMVSSSSSQGATQQQHMGRQIHTTFSTSLRQTKSPDILGLGSADDELFLRSHQSIQQQQQLRRTIQISSPSGSSSRLFHRQPGSAPVRPHSLLASSWLQAEEGGFQQQASESNAGDSDGLGSPSTLDLDLDSPSSSSLLDQLRSRGYRSMINQRMVSTTSSQQQMGEQGAASVEAQSSSSAIQVKRSEGSSTAMQQQQIITSSAASINQLSQQQMRSSQQHSRRRVYTSSTSSSVASGKTQKHQHIAVLDELSDEACGGGDAPDDAAVTNASQAPKKPQGEPKVNGNHRGELLEKCSTEKVAEPEPEPEMDEDVKEAKENIKAYVERMRETELFLKSVQEEEEKTDRERQQRFHFDNLLLSAKLHGIQSQIYKPKVSTRLEMNDAANEYAAQSNGVSSAPIRQTFGSSWFSSTESNECYTPSIQSQSAAVNGQGTFDWATWNSTRPVHKRPVGFQYSSENLTNDNPYGSDPSTYRRSYVTGSMQKLNSSEPFCWEPTTTVFDTSLPYTPASSAYSPMRRDFRRSKSQLGDQFTSTSQRRPLSMHLTSDLSSYVSPKNELNTSRTSPVRAKRAASQVRYSTSGRLSQPPVTSEYRSSFVDHSCSQSNGLMKSQESSKEKSGNDEDDDHGLSAYRVGAYIPRIRRDTQVKDDADETFSSEVATKPATRRISLDEHPTSHRKQAFAEPAPEASKQSPRRASLSSGSANEPPAQPGKGEEKSRLQELERRLAENRRRREELLASNQSLGSSPIRKSRAQISETKQPASDVAADTCKAVTDRDRSCDSSAHLSQSAKTQSAFAPRFSSSTRPSRLESMEARIKRRSYCVRMCSPERTRSASGTGSSLEQWQTRRLSSGGFANAAGSGRARSPSANN